MLWMDQADYRVIKGNFDDLSDPSVQELKPTADAPAKRRPTKPRKNDKTSQNQSDTDQLRQLLDEEKNLESELEISWPDIYNITDTKN